jgi:hypothetical protein
MDQQSFNFQHDEDRFIHHQLDELQYQSLVDLMAVLIITAFQSLEKPNHAQSQSSNQNKD